MNNFTEIDEIPTLSGPYSSVMYFSCSCGYLESYSRFISLWNISVVKAFFLDICQHGRSTVATCINTQECNIQTELHNTIFTRCSTGSNCKSFRSTCSVEFVTTLCWSMILCKASQRGPPLHQLKLCSCLSTGRGQVMWSSMDSFTATRQTHPTRYWRCVTEVKQ